MITQLLKDKRLRLTSFRKEVLQVFMDNDKAIAVSDIEDALNDFDRITLYRTIKSFIEKGLIHEIVMPGDVKKLALCAVDCNHEEGVHDHSHIHFQCKICKEVFCVDVPSLPNIDLPGYQIDEVEIQVHGVCEKCK
ncbi:MAG: transcriptional repressor [Crocinitomicaceae bacterium]|nr:transcriptional repressor [Crocinitomicaceae bacterium]